MSVTKESTTSARAELYEQYAHLIEINRDLDRKLVSYQANKSEAFYRWFKYKEGFSSKLVRYLLDRLAPRAGDLLDPFAGAGAALFASRERGWNATGIEALPPAVFAMQAHHAAEHVDAGVFASEAQQALAAPLDSLGRKAPPFPHLRITRSAFPAATERQISGFLAYCNEHVSDPHTSLLLQFACFCVLEDVSYTRKDGQYLRWDTRCARKRVRGAFNKGTIHSFKDALRHKVQRMVRDLEQNVFLGNAQKGQGTLDIRCGSCLDVLPTLRARSFDLVITSPPYCNRYDYTRTYALELAFLGYDDEQVKNLRQELLSSTVENKSKERTIEAAYRGRRHSQRLKQALALFEEQEALHEVLESLEECRQAGSLNNSNIPRMVENYFLEMALVVFELARVMRAGGHVVMVNDNVRYAGEHVPVDLILTDMACKAGLEPKHIWALPRGKGNSSQQMGAHGRQELRKCVYVWERPSA